MPKQRTRTSKCVDFITRRRPMLVTRKYRPYIFIIITAILFVAYYFFYSSHKIVSNRHTVEKVITNVYSCDLNNIAISSSGTKIAYIMRQATPGTLGKVSVKINNITEKPFDDILVSSLCFSPEKEDLYYVAQEKDVFYLIKNGRIVSGGSNYHFDDSSLFSHNEKFMIYIIKYHGKYQCVINGKASPRYDEISYPIYDTIGEHYAYKYKRNNKFYLCFDGHNSQGYDELGIPTISQNNGHCAYTARNGTNIILNIDGREVPVPPTVCIGHCVVSSDGKKYGYEMKNGNGFSFVYNNQVSDAYEMIYRPSMSDDEKHIYFMSRIKKKYYFVIDNKPELPCDDISTSIFTYSSKKQTFAYAYMAANKWYIKYGKQNYGPYEKLMGRSLILSKNGNHIGFAIERQGKCRYVINGIDNGRGYVSILSMYYKPLFVDETHIRYIALTTNTGSNNITFEPRYKLISVTDGF